MLCFGGTYLLKDIFNCGILSCDYLRLPCTSQQMVFVAAVGTCVTSKMQRMQNRHGKTKKRKKRQIVRIPPGALLACSLTLSQNQVAQFVKVWTGERLIETGMKLKIVSGAITSRPN